MILINFDEPAWPELADEDVHDVRQFGLTLLAGGMKGGRSSVALRVDLPDGVTAIVQCSLDQLETAVRTCRAREQYLASLPGVPVG